MKRTTRASLCALFGALLAASMVAAPAALAGPMADEISQLDPEAGDRVRSVEALLTPVESITSAIPANPQEALIDATSGLSADLGFPQDPTAQIRLAQLPDEVAGRLANVLTVMRECNAITQRHWAEIEPRLEEVAAGDPDLDPANFADIRTCAQSLWTVTNELELTFTGTRSHPSTFGCPNAHPSEKPPLQEQVARSLQGLDVWPVIRLDSVCMSNTYSNDYLLTVDLGFGDTYANNAGSNMVDLNYAPLSSRVPGLRGFGPARGCQLAIAGLRQGDCVPAVAVVLDLADGDSYGVLQSPDVDRRCTPATSQLVRRMVTGAVGFLGVGILRDVEGFDRYTSKTVSLGAGHIFGVGVLSDASGDDSYLSVRNSQGFGLVGGAGILADEAGNDSYDYYMPPAITPGLPNQVDGTGGVLDDESRQEGGIDFEGKCDRIARFTQGTGNVTPASLGILVDFAGTDRYRGGFFQFNAPGTVPPAEGDRGGSMGFGANGGAGIFLDLGSAFDSYTTDAPAGTAPLRWNDLLLLPGNGSTGRSGLGLFADR